MKNLSLVGPAAALALCLATPGFAQENVTVRTSSPRQGAIARTITSSRPAWLEKVVDINIKNERPADAVKRIVKQAGKSLENVELDEGLSDERLSLSVKKVKVGDALAAVGRIGGAIASVSERDDKVTVYLKKRNDRVSMFSEIPAMGSLFVGGESGNAFPKEAQAEIERALADAGRAIDIARPKLEGIARTFPPLGAFSPLSAKLPEKRVSVDLKKVEVRDALKKILGDAGVAYALDADLPTDANSFTFENVPLATALDLVCASANVGWRAEKADDKGGVIVKVAKKYFGNSRNGALSFILPGPDSNLLGDLGEPAGEIRTILTDKG